MAQLLDTYLWVSATQCDHRLNGPEHKMQGRQAASLGGMGHRSKGQLCPCTGIRPSSPQKQQLSTQSLGTHTGHTWASW